MRICRLTTHYYSSHCYLVIEDNHAIIIDPGDADIVKKVLLEEDLTVDFGILTHEHCDHVCGVSAIREETGCRMIASKACDINLRDCRKNYSQYYDAFIEVQTRIPVDSQKLMDPFTTNADELFENEMNLEWRGHSILLHETPGHSQGSICIVIDNAYLFSGDTLMKDDSTETHFIGGNKQQFAQITMPWLNSLPESLTVYAGHGDSFRLGDRL